MKETFLKGSLCKRILEEWMEFSDFVHLETWKKRLRGGEVKRIAHMVLVMEVKGRGIGWEARLAGSSDLSIVMKKPSLSSYALKKGPVNSRMQACGHSSAAHLVSQRAKPHYLLRKWGLNTLCFMCHQVTRQGCVAQCCVIFIIHVKW